MSAIVFTSQDLERFWAKVDLWFGITDEDCWEWKAFLNAASRGKFWINGRDHFSARVAFAIRNGTLPSGLACHTCDNPRCVNPSHLYDGNEKTNRQDAIARGRIGVLKYHCRHGHAFTPENTGWSWDKIESKYRRVCRQCYRGFTKKYYDKHKKKD